MLATVSWQSGDMCNDEDGQSIERSMFVMAMVNGGQWLSMVHGHYDYNRIGTILTQHNDFIFYGNFTERHNIGSNVRQSALILRTITGLYVFHVSGSPPTYSRVESRINTGYNI